MTAIKSFLAFLPRLQQRRELTRLEIAVARGIFLAGWKACEKAKREVDGKRAL